MKEIEETKAKRTQRDYTLGFKLALVDLVEKGEMTYISKPSPESLWNTRKKYRTRMAKGTW